MHKHSPMNCFVPPHILKNIATKGTENQRALAIETLKTSEQMRGQRQALADFSAAAFRVQVGTKERIVYDARNGSSLPGTIARQENDPATADVTVNEAFDGSGVTYDLFSNIYQRNSIDASGMRLDSTVHYQRGYDNAFWNGEQMVFGDGDGEIFLDFTVAIDVIAHELAHGLTQYTANLAYEGQSGALNESVSDVFGSLVKQYSLGQSADQGDWLIGAGLLAPRVSGVALRSMKAPGTAYDDDVLGKDPQPGSMDDYVETDEDDGGVHINSGIPNRAFHLLATALGGNAWERAGRIWFDVLTGQELAQDASFRDFAKLTVAAAQHRFGEGDEAEAVLKAWSEVGVPTR